MTDTFDAVLLISFGGPHGMDDIRPFLANVVRRSRAAGNPELAEGRGRRVPPARLEEVAHHYELFGGVSPITELTQKQADGLQQRLAAAGRPLPVFVGMRNWSPYLRDTLAEMSRAGIRRAIGFVMAPHASYSSCEQYRENVRDARQAIREQGLADIEITYVAGWHMHDGFIAANAANVRAAIAKLPVTLRSRARVVFTAHSIPLRMAEQSKYQEQLHNSAREVGRAAELTDWTVVYQSRSGSPQDPWLEPDISDYLRAAAVEGLRAVVLCPLGFVCDHIEVLYDLDVEAADVAREHGITLTRATAVNDHPLFLDMMADVVLGTVQRYSTGRPLVLLHQGKPPMSSD